MRQSYRICLTVGVILAVCFAGNVLAADKIKIEKLDDLPRHTYTLEIKALELLENDEAFGNLVAAVKADLESDLATYEIDDKSTLQGYYGTLGSIALLEEQYDDWFAYFELSQALEDKEAVKLTNGLSTRAYIKAIQSGAEDPTVPFREAYTELVNVLPYDIVGADLKQSKGRSEIFSENLILGIIESRIQPMLDQTEGVMSKDIAFSLIGMVRNIRMYLPFKDIVGEVLGVYLDANAVEKEEIWTARQFELPAEAPAKEVVVAIWDSGTDPDVYGDGMWTNKNETPGNGIDDDNNGYIDDICGIAYTLHSEKTSEVMFPIGDVTDDLASLQRQMKGLEDVTSNIDSEEANEVRKAMSSLPREEVRPFIESIAKYGNFSHGTHVAGIAVRGNPFAKILSARLTFGYEMIPEEPTVEQAEKDAIAATEFVEYFKTNGVRVVNMSWGGTLAGVESALEANNAGGTPEERKALARKIFEIDKQALFNAIKNAPDILFVTSAGNADADVNFEEFIPSSFDLPNIMSVGAVDQAGDETSFTCFGKVDAYANGFEVESYVPGGDKLTMSGTSQASPQVVNLAAKLFALNADLTPTQVTELIVNGCDEHAAGERSVKLINPKKTVMMMAQMK